MPIKNVPYHYPRLGRISLGYMTSKEKDDRTVTYPVRTKTFVFHSDMEERLAYVARVYGGAVEPAVSVEEEGGSFRLISTVDELDCILPAEDERGFDAWWEKWSASGLVRRCDGEQAIYAVDTTTGEVKHDVPCVCDALGLEDDERCAPTSRLNVLIPALYEGPGIGVWQVQSRGLGTYRAWASVLDLLRRGGNISGLPFVLRAEYRQIRTEQKGKAVTREVPVIAMDTRLSFAQADARRKGPPQLEAGETPPPDREQAPLGALPHEAGEQEPPPTPVVPESTVVERSAVLASMDKGQLDTRLNESKAASMMDDRDLRELSVALTGKRARGELSEAEYRALIVAVEAIGIDHVGWEEAVQRGKKELPVVTA